MRRHDDDQLPALSDDRGLLADEDVLPQLQRWQAEGQRTALVTLVGVEGGAPRQPGAQMAVAEDGRYAGYLSGGCLEQAVALEAQAVIARRAEPARALRQRIALLRHQAAVRQRPRSLFRPGLSGRQLSMR